MKKLIIATMITMICCSIGIKVKADTLTNWSTQQGRIQTTHDGTDSWTSWENINGDNSLVLTPTYPVKAISWRVRATNGMSRENTYTFRFNYKPTPDAINPSSFYFQNDTTGEQEQNVICSVERYDSGYYWYKCDFTPDTSYTSTQYLYIKINFNVSYLTEMRMGIRGYEERKSTNAVITEQTIDLINNSNENTQEIINNINQANENLLNGLEEQNQVCKVIDKNSIKTDNYYLDTSGTLNWINGYGITDYLSTDGAKIKTIATSGSGTALCYYTEDKTLINCIAINTLTLNQELTYPNNTRYVRITIRKDWNTPRFNYCKNGNQAIIDTDHTYTENNINGTVDEYEQIEGQIDNITDISLTDKLNILWETAPMTWIWQTFDTIRGSYQKVFGLMTSFLALGVIRLVLGR